MMFSKLRGLIRERGLTERDVATAIGMSPSLFSQKLSGRSAMNREVIIALCNYLSIDRDNIGVYFFSQDV